MAFPTLGIIDNFTRANADPLSGGPGWTGPIWTGERQIRLVTNQVTTNAADSYGNSYIASPMYGPDLEAYCTLTSAWSSGDRIIFYFRTTVGSPNGYRCQFRDVGGDDLIFIDKDTVPIGSTIDPADTFASGDKFGVEVIGDTITAYYKSGAGAWTNMGSRTDSTYTGPGYLGLALTGATLTVDDFGGGTLGGGGGGGGGANAARMLTMGVG